MRGHSPSNKVAWNSDRRSPVNLAQRYAVFWDRDPGLTTLEAARQRRAIDRALDSFRSAFALCADCPRRFAGLLLATFGPGYDELAAEQIRLKTRRGEFDWLPPVRMCSVRTLHGTLGTFERATGWIYLRRDLLSDNDMLALVCALQIARFLATKLMTQPITRVRAVLFARLVSKRPGGLVRLRDALQRAVDPEASTSTSETLAIDDGVPPMRLRVKSAPPRPRPRANSREARLEQIHDAWSTSRRRRSRPIRTRY